jgi:hypothetical protein
MAMREAGVPYLPPEPDAPAPGAGEGGEEGKG